MELPTKKRAPIVEDPKFLILFGKQKSSKTTILAALKDCLILDFEQGTHFVEALTIEINNFSELVKVKQLLEAKMQETGEKPYKRIALDTATTLEELLMEYAIILYKDTAMGKNFKGDNLRKLPNGAGYLYEREAYKKIIAAFSKYCDTLILAGHVSDKMVEKNGKEVWEMEIDLTGKLKRIIGAKADAIGYVYRDKNKSIISFKGGEDAIAESRPRHLSGKDIVIAESEGEGEDMEITFHWDKIFKNL